MSLSEQELIVRLGLTEDSFVERKSRTDKGGWLRTTVAFANSTPVGYPSVLFLGVEDDGTIQDHGNVEATMKAYSACIAENAYPPIYTEQRVVQHQGREFVAVIIPGSSSRPHFAGKAYVRDGTQTRESSETEFAQLIAQRSSKAGMLVGKVGEPTTVESRYLFGGVVMKSSTQYRIGDCNHFFVTLQHEEVKSALWSLPLSSFEISWDHNYNRLKIIISEIGPETYGSI